MPSIAEQALLELENEETGYGQFETNSIAGKALAELDKDENRAISVVNLLNDKDDKIENYVLPEDRKTMNDYFNLAENSQAERQKLVDSAMLALEMNLYPSETSILHNEAKHTGQLDFYKQQWTQDLPKDVGLIKRATKKFFGGFVDIMAKVRSESEAGKTFVLARTINEKEEFIKNTRLDNEDNVNRAFDTLFPKPITREEFIKAHLDQFYRYGRPTVKIAGYKILGGKGDYTVKSFYTNKEYPIPQGLDPEKDRELILSIIYEDELFNAGTGKLIKPLTIEEKREKIIDKVLGTFTKRYERAQAEIAEETLGYKITRVPPPTKLREKIADPTVGVLAFFTKLALAKKVIGGKPGLGQDVVSWEFVNEAEGGTPGAGAAMRLTFTAINKIPAASIAGKTARTGTISGLFMGMTAAGGGDSEDIIISGLIPIALNAYSSARGRFRSVKAAKQLQKQYPFLRDVRLKDLAKFNRIIAEAKTLGDPKIPQAMKQADAMMWLRQHGRFVDGFLKEVNSAFVKAGGQPATGLAPEKPGPVTAITKPPATVAKAGAQPPAAAIKPVEPTKIAPETVSGQIEAKKEAVTERPAAPSWFMGPPELNQIANAVEEVSDLETGIEGEVRFDKPVVAKGMLGKAGMHEVGHVVFNELPDNVQAEWRRVAKKAKGFIAEKKGGHKKGLYDTAKEQFADMFAFWFEVDPSQDIDSVFIDKPVINFMQKHFGLHGARQNADFAHSASMPIADKLQGRRVKVEKAIQGIEKGLQSVPAEPAEAAEGQIEAKKEAAIRGVLKPEGEAITSMQEGATDPRYGFPQQESRPAGTGSRKTAKQTIMELVPESQEKYKKILNYALEQEKFDSNKPLIESRMEAKLAFAIDNDIDFPFDAISDEHQPLEKLLLKASSGILQGYSSQITNREERTALNDAGLQNEERIAAKNKFNEKLKKLYNFESQVQQIEKENRRIAAKSEQQKRWDDVEEFIRTGQTKNQNVIKFGKTIKSLYEVLPHTSAKIYKELIKTNIDFLASGDKAGKELAFRAWYASAKNYLAKELRKAGFFKTHKSEKDASGSVYYERFNNENRNIQIRISDHELPETPARQYYKYELGYGTKWDKEIVLDTICPLSEIKQEFTDFLLKYKGEKWADEALAKLGEAKGQVRGEETKERAGLTPEQEKNVKALRKQIHAVAAKKGLTKKALSDLKLKHTKYRGLTGKVASKKITTEQLQNLLKAVEKARPGRVGYKRVITRKTEKKIQSLKDNLIKKTQMTEADYRQILMKEVHGKEPKYTDAKNFITEKQGKDIIKRMLNEAVTLKLTVKMNQSINENPEIKSAVDNLINIPFKTKDPWRLSSMRFYVQKLAKNSDRRLFNVYQAIIDKNCELSYERSKILNKFKELPEFDKISKDEKAAQRIEDYIVSKSHLKGRPAYPKDITENELKIAKEIERIYYSYRAPVRILKFMEWYENDKPETGDYSIPEYDKYRTEINKAVDIYETKGLEELIDYLGTQDWGVIRTGYDFIENIKTKIRAYKMSVKAFTKTPIKVRENVEYAKQEKTIFQRLPSYMKQIDALSGLRPLTNSFVQIIEDNIDKFDNPKHIRKSIETFLLNLKYSNWGEGWVETIIKKLYSQALTVRVLGDPIKVIRNYPSQNLVFEQDKSIFFDPRNKPLVPEEIEYIEKYIRQDLPMLHEWVMIGEKPLPIPGIRGLTNIIRKYTAYPWSDKKNRYMSAYGKINQINRAIKSAKEKGEININQLMKNAKFSDYTTEEQILALGLLASEGEEAMALYLTRCHVQNTHFLYGQAERSPAEQTPMGRLTLHLFLFHRAALEKLFRNIDKIKQKGATKSQRLRAAKVVATLLVSGWVFGLIWKKMTGQKRNPYNFIQFLEAQPGGLAWGATEAASTAYNNLLNAASGDSKALEALAVSIPALADLEVPFYKLMMDGIEATLDKTNLDRLAIRKIREMIHEEYKVREDAYNIDRNAFEKLQRFLGGAGVDVSIKEKEKQKKRLPKSRISL